MYHKRHPPVGARPGTLVIDAGSAHPSIHVIDYGPDTLTEKQIERVEDLRPYLESPTVTWIDVQGLGDETILRELAELLGLHPLAMEDVVNVPARPKTEALEKHLLFITRMVKLAEDDAVIDREQLSLLVGERFVVTFQERYGDVFDPVRERIRAGNVRIRGKGVGYLAYAIIDTVIDAYYPVLERFGDHLEELETEVVNTPARATLRSIYSAKRELLEFRRAVWPQREAVNAIVRGDDKFFSGDVRVYFRDVYDHVIQVIDVLETYREMTGGLLDVYLSSISNRTNDVMKVLTIMASIFIPLTFIAGVYGMNFDFMPELHVRAAYPIVIVVMVLTALGMVWFFARKGWIGSGDQSDDEDK